MVCVISLLSLSNLHVPIGYITELSYILSILMCLERLSITTLVTESEWAFPEIIRAVNTSPVLQNVVLRLRCVPDSITHIAQLNWSLLDHLKINSTGKCPRIDLCVTGRHSLLGTRFCPEGILDALAKNEALMDLVKQGLVVLTTTEMLKSEHRASWQGFCQLIRGFSFYRPLENCCFGHL